MSANLFIGLPNFPGATRRRIRDILVHVALRLKLAICRTSAGNSVRQII